MLLGELVGAGVGLVLSGEIAGLVGRRWAYWWLAVASVLLAVALARVPEPPRRRDTNGADDAIPQPEYHGEGTAARPDTGVGPRAGLVLNRDPTSLNTWQVIRYVLRIPTNLVLVLASTAGYYFFAGMQTFAVSYLREHFDLAQTTVSLLFPMIGAGAVIGVFAGGMFGDRWRQRGHPSGRVLAVLIAFFGATVFLLGGLVSSILFVTVPLLTIAAFFLGAANPPLDAARIDIMPRPLVGRAESVRTIARNSADASAPAVFGLVAGHIGLRDTFLIMVGPMVLGGLLGLIALRTYPADVAAAEANNRRIAERHRGTVSRGLTRFRRRGAG